MLPHFNFIIIQQQIDAANGTNPLKPSKPRNSSVLKLLSANRNNAFVINSSNGTGSIIRLCDIFIGREERLASESMLESITIRMSGEMVMI